MLGGVNLTGLVDGYYGYNANHPPAPGTITEPFSYRRDAFGLNLIELQLDKPVDKSSPLGFRVALGFGDAINAVNECSFCNASANGDGDQTGTQYLKEGYLSYMAPVGKGLEFDFGKFVTPAGAEVMVAKGHTVLVESLAGVGSGRPRRWQPRIVSRGRSPEGSSRALLRRARPWELRRPCEVHEISVQICCSCLQGRKGRGGPPAAPLRPGPDLLRELFWSSRARREST